MASTYNFLRPLLPEFLKRWETDFIFAKIANRNYEAKFDNNGAVESGSTVDIPVWNMAVSSDNAGYDAMSGDINEEKISMTIDKYSNTKWFPSVSEQQFLIKHQRAERVQTPRSEVMSTDLELDLSWRLFRETYFFSGQANTQVNTYQAIADLAALMNIQGISKNERFLVLDDIIASKVSGDGFKNVMDVALVRAFQRKNIVPVRSLAFSQIVTSTAVIRHIAGTGLPLSVPASGLVACGTVKTNVADGATSLTLTGWGGATAAVINEGDKLVIPSVFRLHPTQKTLTTLPVQLAALDAPDKTALPTPTVPQDTRYTFNADTNGDVVLTFSKDSTKASCPLYYTNTLGRQNINTQILAGTPVYLVTASQVAGATDQIPYICNMAFNYNALHLAAPPLPPRLSKDGDMVQRNKETGVGITMYLDGDITGAAPAYLPRTESRWILQWGRMIEPYLSFGLISS